MQVVIRETGEIENIVFLADGKDKFRSFYGQTLEFWEDFILTDVGMKVSKQRFEYWQKVVKKEQELADFLAKDKKVEVRPDERFHMLMASSFDRELMDGVHFRMDLCKMNIHEQGRIFAMQNAGQWDSLTEAEKDQVYQKDIDDEYVVFFKTRHE